MKHRTATLKQTANLVTTWVLANLSKIGLVIFLFSFVVVLPSPVSAQTVTWSGVCVGSGPNIDVATIQGAECLIANVFMVIITLIGLVGFVMFIIGALQWMVSGSNTQSVTKARSTMMYAVAGLVIALCAFIIIGLIADFTGVNVIRSFRIPTSTRGLGPGNCGYYHPGASCVNINYCNQTSYGPTYCNVPGQVCCGP